MIAPRPFLSSNNILVALRPHLASPVLLLALLLMGCNFALAQQTTAKPLHLGKIEVTGLERYTQEQVVTESGLQLGQLIDIPAVDEAASRLMSSGLFKKLSYRFRTVGNQATVTFQVEENRESIPVVFDNFVWFSDQELQAAVRREVPSYDGTVPESGEMPDKIQKALQGLLNERKIQGHVEYLSSAGAKSQYIFSVKGIKIPICTLLFPGAKDVKESELVNGAKPLFSEEAYSALDVAAFVKVNLIPIYRQRGHLRASFLDPVAKPQADGTCKNGVSVTMQVDEGSVYTWDKAEWSGNAVLKEDALTAALGMKTGELANGLKIDKAIKAVFDAYAKRGYLTATFRPMPEFDDANRRVIYHYEVKEGQQYHMGALALRGFSDDEANRLKDRWKMQTGDVFDALYPSDFLKKNLREIMSPGAAPKDIKADIKPDQQTLTVDVIISAK